MYASSVKLNAAQNVCPFDLNGGCINPPDDLEKDNDDASSSGEDKVSDASERVDWMVKPVLTFFCPRYLAVTTAPSLHCCHLNLISIILVRFVTISTTPLLLYLRCVTMSKCISTTTINSLP